MNTITKTLLAMAASACMMVSAAQAGVFLTGAEVAKHVVGNTIEGQYRECGAARHDFKEFYSEDGKISGKERACNHMGSWTSYGGTWAVKDGKFCVNLGSGRTSGCYDYEGGPDSTLTRVDEPGVGNTHFKIYEGKMK